MITVHIVSLLASSLASLMKCRGIGHCGMMQLKNSQHNPASNLSGLGNAKEGLGFNLRKRCGSEYDFCFRRATAD
jgi:hypothetical protein